MGRGEPIVQTQRHARGYSTSYFNLLKIKYKHCARLPIATTKQLFFLLMEHYHFIIVRMRIRLCKKYLIRFLDPTQF